MSLGYPVYVLDRLRDTTMDYTAQELAVLLSAHSQMIALQSAEVSQVIQSQLQRLNSHDGAEPEEEMEDGNALVQTSSTVATKDDISSFGHYIDRMSAGLSAMPVPRQRASAEILRGFLTRRYGRGVGRASMEERARTVEALVAAYGICEDDPVSDLTEKDEDRKFANKWWAHLVDSIMADDACKRNEDVRIEVNDSQDARLRMAASSADVWHDGGSHQRASTQLDTQGELASDDQPGPVHATRERVDMWEAEREALSEAKLAEERAIAAGIQ